MARVEVGTNEKAMFELVNHLGLVLHDEGEIEESEELGLSTSLPTNVNRPRSV